MKRGFNFPGNFGPSILWIRSWQGWVSFTSGWQANKLGEKKTALAKWFDNTGSFVPLWNADCAIFFVKQDSHWVEDKQLFIKRNQELLEKVCWAQYPSGAEETMMRDPGAAGVLSGVAQGPGEGAASRCCILLCCVLDCIPVTAITISGVARVHGSVLGIAPTQKDVIPDTYWCVNHIYIYTVYMLYIHIYIYIQPHVHTSYVVVHLQKAHYE